MKPIAIISAITILAAACGPAPAPNAITGCSGTVSAVRALWAGYPLPDYLESEHPVERGGEFDPNAYFGVLDGLAMEPGYSLDFVYSYDWLGSYPTLLARPANSAPYLSWDDVPGPAGDYLDHVQADGTPESYFQFVVLDIMASQFYLVWHANYNDLRIVCDRAALRAIVNGLAGDEDGQPMPAHDRAQALSLRGVDPTVDIGGQTVAVRVVTFTRWGGFYADTFTLSRNFPHKVLDIQHKLLVPYDCGIMF